MLTLKTILKNRLSPKKYPVVGISKNLNLLSLALLAPPSPAVQPDYIDLSEGLRG